MASIQQNRSWEVNPEKVDTVVRRIIELSSPLKLILFGSYVRGEMNINSDLDVLVITADEITDTRKESVRIRRALRGISIPMWIFLLSRNRSGKSLRMCRDWYIGKRC